MAEKINANIDLLCDQAKIIIQTVPEYIHIFDPLKMTDLLGKLLINFKKISNNVAESVENIKQASKIIVGDELIHIIRTTNKVYQTLVDKILENIARYSILDAGFSILLEFTARSFLVYRTSSIKYQSL